jgi:hypothetical protein
MIFQFVMVIATWANKALEDGKITATEGLELVGKLAGLLGVPLELEVPDLVTTTIDEITGEPDKKESAAILSKPDYEGPE